MRRVLAAFLLSTMAATATVPARSAPLPEIQVINQTPLMTAADLQATTRGEWIVLQGRFYWKTVHGEDVDRFVLDVTFLDAVGKTLARGTVDGDRIQLGLPFEVPIGRWLPAPDGLDPDAVRRVVLTVKQLRILPAC